MVSYSKQTDQPINSYCNRKLLSYLFYYPRLSTYLLNVPSLTSSGCRYGLWHRPCWYLVHTDDQSLSNGTLHDHIRTTNQKIRPSKVAYLYVLFSRPNSWTSILLNHSGTITRGPTPKLNIPSDRSWWAASIEHIKAPCFTKGFWEILLIDKFKNACGQQDYFNFFYQFFD